MRNLSKALIVAVGLVSICGISSTVRANTDGEIASFKLSHPAQWNSAKLPAGDYTLSLVPNAGGTKMLLVQGENQGLQILVYAQSSCGKCRNGMLNLAVLGDRRVVTSLDMPGYHLDFKSAWTPADREQMSKAPKNSKPAEQVAIQQPDQN